MNFFRASDAQTDALPSLSLSPISLLTPQPKPHPSPTTTPWEDDLGLQELVNALTLDRRHQSFTRGVLAEMQTDETNIRWRQQVLQDFLDNPGLADAIEVLLPAMNSMGQDAAMLGRRTRSLLMETSDRLSELDLYTELVEELHKALVECELQSEALQSLQTALEATLQKPEYQQLRSQLPAMRAPLQDIGSITVGINLDLNLKPISAVLMAINGRDVGDSPSLLNRLFQSDNDSERELKGIAAAHRFPRGQNERRYTELFQDVDRLMKQTAKPVAQALRRYVKTSSRTLVTLEPELAFFVAATKLTRRLQAEGVPICKPIVKPARERYMAVKGLHNLQLALREESHTIPSDVRFDEDGHVAVLTGPNSGGKTTYLRSVGLAQVVFQAGLFLPANEAVISPVANLLTHFPRLETRQQGRLEEEAERLRTLFEKVGENTLVLLNETFSSTAFGEAIYLAQDVLSALCALETRAIFATHLVELVDHFEEIERAAGQGKLYSLVAGIQIDATGTPRPTYQVTRGEPLGRSFAQEIARKYGIGLEQILAEHGRPKPEA